MKTLFLTTKYNKKITLPKQVIGSLPASIGLFSTAQFIGALPSIERQLKKAGKKPVLFKTKHTKYKGQIYGCNLDKYDGVDAFLYIGEGMFHPKALLIGNNKKVHIWNPISRQYSVIDKRLIEKELNRQKAALSLFLMKKNIGVILSTKHGQSYLEYAFRLSEKYPEKSFYYIVYNDIDFSRMEDFPFIDVWVNTACPRIAFDDSMRSKKPIVDIFTIFNGF